MSIPGDALTLLAMGANPADVLGAVRRAEAEHDAYWRSVCAANGWEYLRGEWPLDEWGADAGAEGGDEPSAEDRYLASLAASKARRAMIDVGVDAWAFSRPDAPAKFTRPANVGAMAWQCAVHEASHVVAAVALDMSLVSVFVTREGRGTTECTRSESMLANCVELLAGAEGENRFTAGGPFRPSASDLMYLAAETSDVAVHDRAKRAASNLLATNAGAVERVALKLIERGHLTGDEATSAAGELRRHPD